MDDRITDVLTTKLDDLDQSQFIRAETGHREDFFVACLNHATGMVVIKKEEGGRGRGGT